MIPPNDTPSEHLRNFLSVFLTDNLVVELRAPKSPQKFGYPKTEYGFFELVAGESPKLLIAAINSLVNRGAKDQPQGIYLTINPVNPNLLGRACNNLKVCREREASGASDKEIVYRRWLVADLDPVRTAGVSATDAEKDHARAAMERIRAELSSRGWPQPMAIDSGNGFHLWYRIDLPCDDGGTVKHALKALASQFDTERAKVDTSLFNPSRIIKIPGTWARKGDSIPDRPHRMARVVEVPDTIEIVPTYLIESLAAEGKEKPKHALAVETNGKHESNPLRLRPRRSDPASRCRAYLAKIPGAVDGQHGSDDTFRAARIVWNDFGLNAPEGYPILQEWNAKCDPPWPEEGSQGLKRKWDEAVKHGPCEKGRGWKCRDQKGDRSERRQSGHIDSSGFALPLEGELWDDPHRIARLFAERHLTSDNMPTLLQWREEWHEWNGAAWNIVPDSDLDARLARHTREVFETDLPARHEAAAAAAEDAGKEKFDEPKLFKVTTKLRSDVRLNLAGIINQPDTGTDPPFWVISREDDLDAADAVATPNGLFTLERLATGLPAFAPPTPRLFTPTALPFAVPTTIGPPALWLKCVNDWFNGDAESIAGLQEWAGYLLSADTSLHKVLFLVGPRRSGKGTILDTLTQLIGGVNVASMTFAALGENFGLESLLGKRVAIIPDGRLSGRTDTSSVVERLLSISGEDSQSVNRKNRRRVTAKLKARFVIASNEVPRLPDASGALASRFYILHTPNSWFGKEDRGLKGKLRAELPGILKWAAEGWVRLQQQGAFTVNDAAEQYQRQLDDLSSPIRAFVRDACSVGPECEVRIAELFAAWRDWNYHRHREVGSEAIFGRDLHAACPHIKVRQVRRDGTVVRVYYGIGLRDKKYWGEPNEVSRDVTRDFPTHACAQNTKDTR